MNRRSSLLVFIAFVGLFAFAVSGCANDYDQFDFTLGQPRETRDGNGGEDRTADAPAPDRGWVAPPDAGTDETGTDAPGPEGNFVADGARDAEDAPSSADAVGEADASPLGDADAGLLDTGTPGPEPSDDGGPNTDAPAPDAPIEDVSVVDGGSEDADASAADDAGDGSPGEDVSIDGGPPAPDGTAPDGPETPDAGCSPHEKRCGDVCVPLGDPLTGCSNASCSPCSLPHAGAKCDDDGKCAITVCAAGFDDCDLLPENGCETFLANDVHHCGACRRACSDQHTLSRECAGGVCVSTCALGFANCDTPRTGADDGCERAVAGGGLVCGLVPGTCGCAENSNCRGDSSTGSCEKDTGLCRCGPTVCRSGETCRTATGPDACSCNGGPSCGLSETCCQTPAGCHNLDADPSNCGACGRACPNGFFCAAGVCSCNADAQCNAGSPGSCVGGQCVCSGRFCDLGKRCLPGGDCG